MRHDSSTQYESFITKNIGNDTSKNNLTIGESIFENHTIKEGDKENKKKSNTFQQPLNRKLQATKQIASLRKHLNLAKNANTYANDYLLQKGMAEARANPVNMFY